MKSLEEELNHVLTRPGMYVGVGPEASESLAWFLNGYIAAKCKFMFTNMPFFKSDSTISLNSNAECFRNLIKDK